MLKMTRDGEVDFSEVMGPRCFNLDKEEVAAAVK